MKNKRQTQNESETKRSEQPKQKKEEKITKSRKRERAIDQANWLCVNNIHMHN